MSVSRVAAQPVGNFGSRAVAAVGDMGRRSVSVVSSGLSKIGPALASAWAAIVKFFKTCISQPVVNLFAKHGKTIGVVGAASLVLAGIGFAAHKVLGRRTPPQAPANAPAATPNAGSSSNASANRTTSAETAPAAVAGEGTEASSQPAAGERRRSARIQARQEVDAGGDTSTARRKA